MKTINKRINIKGGPDDTRIEMSFLEMMDILKSINEKTEYTIQLEVLKNKKSIMFLSTKLEDYRILKDSQRFRLYLKNSVTAQYDLFSKKMATQRQTGFIKLLALETGQKTDTRNMTNKEASEEIDRLMKSRNKNR